MKKFLALATAVSFISLVSASAADAQSLTPDGVYSVSGYLELYQSIPGVGCEVSGTLNVSGGVGSIDNVTFSNGWPCGNPVYPLTSSWPVVATGAGTIKIYADVNAATGRCAGWVKGVTLSASPNEIVFAGPIGSGSWLHGYLYATGNPYLACYVSGNLAVTGTNTLTAIP